MSRPILQRFSAAIDRFFSPVPIHAMVICRIVFGTALFVNYAGRLPHLQTLYGPSGFFAEAQLEAPLQILQGVPWPWITSVLYGALLLSAIAFALGFRTRWAGVILLVLHTLFHARNPWADWGWPIMMKPFLLCTVLSPAGQVLSIDAWLRRRRNQPPRLDPERAAAWPMRLLQVHVCTMYGTAGWDRLDSVGWQQGEMLYVAAVNTLWARINIDWHPLQPFFEPLSYATFVLEPLAPILLWVPGIGVLWALALIGMHIGIEALTLVGCWNFMMIAALTTFLPTRWLRWPRHRSGSREPHA